LCIDSAPTNDGKNVPESPLPTAAAAVSDTTDFNAFEFIDGVDEDEGSCSCSCDEADDPNVNNDGDAAVDGPTGTSENTEPTVGGATGCSVETQTDPESLSSSVTSLLDPSASAGNDKMTRLCNINELLRQIDEQFNSVLRSTSLTLTPDVTAADAPELSPTNSDEPRGSETEADRACPSRSFPTARLAAGRSQLPYDNLKLDEATALDRQGVTDEPFDRPVIRPVPLVPHSPSPGSVISETTDAGSGPALSLVPYRGSSGTSLVSAASADRLSLPTIQPKANSSSPATVASEGYHSDRVPATEPPAPPLDFPLIIREIPKPSTSTTPPIRFLGDLNMRPQSRRLNSPDDVDV